MIERIEGIEDDRNVRCRTCDARARDVVGGAFYLTEGDDIDDGPFCSKECARAADLGPAPSESRVWPVC